MPPYALNSAETDQVVSELTSIVGHTLTAGVVPHTITFQNLNSSIDNTAFIDRVTVEVIGQPPIADTGFERVWVGDGQFQYRPTGSAWTFTGDAGISGNNSGFTSGNPPAPQGTQVAFLQATGSFSQSVFGWTAGTYDLTFEAAQRANLGTSQQDFKVLVDGSMVGVAQPSGATYQTFTTDPFLISGPGPHTITFQGLSSSLNDTAFIDQIVAQVTDELPIADSGFEQVSVGDGQYQTDPTGSPWYFKDDYDGNGRLYGQAGISANNSPLTHGNPPAPQGLQVAFLQDYGALIMQEVSGWTAGTYQLSFEAAQRANSPSQESFLVGVGSLQETFTPSGTSYQTYTTSPFVVPAGTNTITFGAYGSPGAGDVAFIDHIVVTPVTTDRQE